MKRNSSIGMLERVISQRNNVSKYIRRITLKKHLTDLREHLFKIIVFFIIMMFAQLYVRVGILLSCGKHWHDCIISLRGEIWSRISSLTPLIFIEVPVPNQ